MSVCSTSRGGGRRVALPLVVLAGLLAAAGSGCSASGGSPATASSYAGEAAPLPGRVTPPRLTRPLPAGSVRLADGPFNDRFVLRKLRWHTKPRPTVTGTLDVNSDVSELLALTITAQFYNASGRLVGAQSYHLTPPTHGAESHPIGADLNRAPFTLRAPLSAAKEATAALLSVPVLVNE